MRQERHFAGRETATRLDNPDFYALAEAFRVRAVSEPQARFSGRVRARPASVEAGVKSMQGLISNRKAQTAVTHSSRQAPTRKFPAWLVLLGSLTAVAPLCIDMYLPSFPEVERALAAPHGSIELTLACFFIGLTLGNYFMAL